MSIRTAAVEDALRRGRFRDAERLLADDALRGQPSDVLRLEVSYYLGRSEETQKLGAHLLRSGDLQEDLLGRCGYIVGCQSWDFGQGTRASELLQRSIEWFKCAKDLARLCSTTAKLLEYTYDAIAFNASLPLAAEVRQAAARCGDPHALVCLHVTLGRLEARGGRLQTALRHFELSHRLLNDHPNLFWEASLCVGESTLFGLMGEVDRALELTRRACEVAREAGWAKGIVAAHLNASHLLLRLGRATEAEDELRLADVRGFYVLNYELAKDATRAQLALRAKRFELADHILNRLEERSTSASAWYLTSAKSVRVQMLLDQRRWEEALTQAEKHLAGARAAGLGAFEASLLLQRAEALLNLGLQLKASDLPFVVHEYPTPLPLLRSLWRVLAQAFERSNQEGRSIQYYGRFARSEASATEHPTVLDDPRQILPSESVLDLDAAAWLFDLAAYPQALGIEAMAILEQSMCAQALALVQGRDGEISVITATGWSDQEVLEAEKMGADVESVPIADCTNKDWRILVRLRPGLEHRCVFGGIRKLISAAGELDQYRRVEKQRAALWPAETLEDSESLWASEPMAEVLALARRVAPGPLTVLLTGETGTGKEVLARDIHRASGRGDRIFLPFNCTAVPKDMLDSQLFGYRKGAFTGADAAFPGVIRSAEGGTLFLDEIADIPLELQPKLLRFLETHEIHPLGEAQPVSVDVRIVAATNASLEQLVAEGRFRADLFYRLNVVRLKLPPLRHRREEIPALVHHYLRKFGDEQKKGQLTLADETLEYLLLFAWPGNVRQLANEVRRMVALAEPDAVLTPALLSPEIQASRRTIPAAPASAGEPELRLRLDQPLPLAVEILEQAMIRSALQRSRGRVEEAAKLLGISRKGLFLKRRRWNLDQQQAS